MPKKSDYSAIYKLLILQLVVGFIFGTGFFLLGTASMAFSSIFGALTAFLPNLIFAYRMSLAKSQCAKKFVHSFYRGESTKLLMTCGLFAAAFQIPGIQFFPLMLSFVAVLSVFWIALLSTARDFNI